MGSTQGLMPGLGAQWSRPSTPGPQPDSEAEKGVECCVGPEQGVFHCGPGHPGRWGVCFGRTDREDGARGSLLERRDEHVRLSLMTVTADSLEVR